jgi:hypothetical protein
MLKVMVINRNTIKEVCQSWNYKSEFFLFKGYLPRASHLKDPPDYLPPFIDPQEWTLEAATFGQNDYIGRSNSWKYKKKSTTNFF